MTGLSDHFLLLSPHILDILYSCREGLTPYDSDTFRKFKHDDKNVHPITYVADFFIVYKDGTEVVIDTKGCPDSVANIKRKLFWYKFPDVDYRWVTYSGIDGGWCSYEYVKKQRAIRRKARREAQKEKMEEENNGKSK